MKFQKAQSGNPRERPKALKEVMELCKEHGPEAMMCIIRLMKSKDERVALAASQAALDRGYGKPAQHIPREPNVSYDISDKPLTVEEWAAKYARGEGPERA